MSNSLKKHSLNEVEKLLSETLSRLCGQRIQVDISSFVDVPVELVGDDDLSWRADIKLTATHDGKYSSAI